MHEPLIIATLISTFPSTLFLSLSLPLFPSRLPSLFLMMFQMSILALSGAVTFVELCTSLYLVGRNRKTTTSTTTQGMSKTYYKIPKY